MEINIICTQDDKDFEKYKNDIQKKKAKFRIKDIFNDHWNNFLNGFPNLNIRETVFKNINKILECNTFSLGYSEYECPNCHKSLIYTCLCFNTSYLW